MASSKDRSLPAKKRVIALDERLTELRSILSEHRTPVPAEPSSTAVCAAPAPIDDDDERKIVRLARMVFMALRSEPRLLARFVHELGKLQATRTETKAHRP